MIQQSSDLELFLVSTNSSLTVVRLWTLTRLSIGMPTFIKNTLRYALSLACPVQCVKNSPLRSRSIFCIRYQASDILFFTRINLVQKVGHCNNYHKVCIIINSHGKLFSDNSFTKEYIYIICVYDISVMRAHTKLKIQQA